jgi:hypothetical protein
MTVPQLDKKAVALIRQLAAEHRCTVADLLAAVIRSESTATAPSDPLLRLLADEPDLLDQVVESAYKARNDALR